MVYERVAERWGGGGNCHAYSSAHISSAASEHACCGLPCLLSCLLQCQSPEPGIYHCHLNHHTILWLFYILLGADSSLF